MAVIVQQKYTRNLGQSPTKPGALSPIGGNLEGWNSPGSKGTWHAHKCISIRTTRTIDLGWVNISCVISGVSGPKFTKFFLFNAELTLFDNAV